MPRVHLILGPSYDLMQFGMIVPHAFRAAIKAEAARLNTSLGDVLYRAIDMQIEAVEFERTDFNPRAEPGAKNGSMTTVKLPIPLMRRVEIRRNQLQWDAKCSGSLSHVVRRCLCLHYPIEAHTFLRG